MVMRLGAVVIAPPPGWNGLSASRVENHAVLRTRSVTTSWHDCENTQDMPRPFGAFCFRVETLHATTSYPRVCKLPPGRPMPFRAHWFWVDTIVKGGARTDKKAYCFTIYGPLWDGV